MVVFEVRRLSNVARSSLESWISVDFCKQTMFISDHSVVMLNRQPAQEFRKAEN